MKSRADIKNYILDIEQRFSVQEWKIGNIHIWPYIRIRLNFYLLSKIGSSEIKNDNHPTPPSPQVKFILLRKVITLLSLVHSFIKYKIWLWNLRQKDFLFAGNDAHRINFNNTRYNRFFDTLIDSFDLVKRTAFIEYGSLKRYDLAYQECHIDFATGLELHKKYWDFKRRLNWATFYKFSGAQSYRNFIEHLKSNALTKDFGISCERPEINFRFVTIYCDLYQKILQKVKPKKLITLCYYTEEMMTLHAVANQLNVTTIEMQHGPIADLHLAYSNWTNIPESGYDMLPRKFWCWDESSCNIINQWSQHNQLYSGFTGGNTWVDLWKNRDEKSAHSNFILYALQPSPIKLDQLFTNQIIDTIRNSSFKWFLRLHPRQMQQKSEIENLVKKHGLNDKVNIDYATNAPLPLLLKHCILTVTHFSGVILEAADFNKFTVLLNPLGEQSFEPIIKKNLAVYLDPYSPSFKKEFERIVAINELRVSEEVEHSIDHQKLVSDIFR